jgi:hypothetical protein
VEDVFGECLGLAQTSEVIYRFGRRMQRAILSFGKDWMNQLGGDDHPRRRECLSEVFNHSV